MVTAAALAVAATAMACGKAAKPAGSPTQAAASGLRAACGPKLVLQTDWFPEPEHGGSYQLIGAAGRVDKAKGSYTGQIGRTGVELEIRAGGPFAGNQSVTSLMYQDPSIFMGYVPTDEAVEQSGKLPTVSVFTLLDQSPLALIWDPSKYHFTSLADIGRSGAKVLYFEGSTFMAYLVGKGILRHDQIDGSYDGSPSRFVAERGAVVQEAFATNEPYKYEHDVPQWGKPVSFALLGQSGYQPYPENIAVRPQALRTKRACLRALVPLMQQAQADYVRDPGPVNQTLLSIVRTLASSWTLSPGGVADAVTKMRDLKVVANGTDGALGSLDMARLQRMIDLLKPIYASEKITTVAPGLRPQDMATDEFIDRRIRL